jgi:transposase
MGKPYSSDLRRGIVQSIEAGHTYEEVAELSGVCVSSVSRLLTRWRSAGSVSPEKFGGCKGYALEPYRRPIERWVDAQPDITLTELLARLAAEEVVVSETAIFRFLRHLEFTSKKAYTPPSKTGQTWPQRGKAWIKLQTKFDPSRLVFIALPSTVQPRSQPDREILFQTQVRLTLIAGRAGVRDGTALIGVRCRAVP